MYSFPLAEKTVCRSPHFCDLMSSSVDNGGLVGGLLRNGIASCSLMKPVSIRMKFKKTNTCLLSFCHWKWKQIFLFVFFATHKSKSKVIVSKSDLITQTLKLFCHVWVSKLIFYFLRYLTYIFDLIDVKKKKKKKFCWWHKQASIPIKQYVSPNSYNNNKKHCPSLRF